jgi:hypothetical protein
MLLRERCQVGVVALPTSSVSSQCQPASAHMPRWALEIVPGGRTGAEQLPLLVNWLLDASS